MPPFFAALFFSPFVRSLFSCRVSLLFIMHCTRVCWVRSLLDARCSAVFLLQSVQHHKIYHTPGTKWIARAVASKVQRVLNEWIHNEEHRLFVCDVFHHSKKSNEKRFQSNLWWCFSMRWYGFLDHGHRSINIRCDDDSARSSLCVCVAF